MFSGMGNVFSKDLTANQMLFHVEIHDWQLEQHPEPDREHIRMQSGTSETSSCSSGPTRTPLGNTVSEI